MLIIIGKTCSGKTTIVNMLVSEHGYKQTITYTTRPIRKGEKQDVTYHFISEEEFKEKVSCGFFAEWKSYNTEFGTWYYGVSLDDILDTDEKSVIILTPDGYENIMKYLKTPHKSVYIYANNSTIQKRLMKRGDDKEEAKRRISQDAIDFKDIEKKVDKIFYNNIDTNIEDIIDKILRI